MIRLRSLIWLTAAGIAVGFAIWTLSGRDVFAAGQANPGGQTPTSAKTGPSDRPADQASIAKTKQAFIEAFNAGDAAKAAALLTEGAELIPDDAPALRGREAIQKAFASHFAKEPGASIQLDAESLRFLSRDTAIEEGHVSIRRQQGAPTAERYSILHVREDGKWLLAGIREWPSEEAGLKELEWLIGSWQADTPQGEVQTTYEWFGDKAFIRATITIKGKERSFSGMQIIGKDPLTDELRVWLFETGGGFAQGTCVREGDTWEFHTEGVQADGSVLAATNLLVRVNEDTITWQPINITLGDEQLEDLPPVKVTRVKAPK